MIPPLIVMVVNDPAVAVPVYPVPDGVLYDDAYTVLQAFPELPSVILLP